MSDPNRWLEDGGTSAEVRSLLSSAAPTPGIPQHDDAVLRRAIKNIASGTLATSTTMGSSITAKLAAAIMFLAVGGGIIYWALRADVHPSTPATQQPAIPARPVVTSGPDSGEPSNPPGALTNRAHTTMATEPHSDSAREVTHRNEVGAHPETARAASPTFPRVGHDAGARIETPGASSGSESVPSGAAPADSLAVEFQYIGRARTLRTTEPAQALSALEAHTRLFPNGVLAPERDYLVVDVLVRLGRRDDARARGNEFLQRYALSPYAPIVRRTLEAL